MSNFRLVAAGTAVAAAAIALAAGPVAAGAAPPSDTSSGVIEAPNAGGMPVFETCEGALKNPTSGEVCTQDELDAFDFWGGRLPLLYASDLPIDLRVWRPVSNRDYELNAAALYACLSAAKGESEYLWVDRQLSLYTDYTAAANEPLFDAAMQYVCPNEGHTRQHEWDGYLPGSPASPPTAAPTPAPTGDPGVPTTAVPGGPPTTASFGTTAGAVIETTDGPTEFTCTQIALATSHATNEVCTAANEDLFARIVANDPDAFNRWIYDELVDIAVFESPDYTVPITAYVGFAACVHLDLGLTLTDWDGFLRGAFPEAASRDAAVTWQSAHDVLCPFATVASS